MDADAIYTEAMAAFKQQQLDGGMSPEQYDNALTHAIYHVAIDQIHRNASKEDNEEKLTLVDLMRRAPKETAAMVQSHFPEAEPDEPIADEDLTIDLDDNDGGGE